MSESFKDFCKNIFSKLKSAYNSFYSTLNGFARFLKLKFLVFYKNHLKEKVRTASKKIDFFQRKYLHKGELKSFVIVRYIVKELLLYFGVAFLFFFMIFFVNQILLIIAEILKKHVSFYDTMRIMLYSLPVVISQSAPFATLVGFLMCLGRIMTDNEVLIFRASGQSYALIMLPVIILGLVISVLSFFVNDWLLPVGNIKYNKLKREIASSNPGVEIEPNSIKFLNDAIIVIGDVQDEVVSDLVFFDDSGRNTQRIIVAGKSRLVSSKKEGVLLQMNMNDSVVASIDSKKRRNFDVLDSGTATFNILESQISGGRTSVSAREMTSYDLGRQIRRMKNQENYSKSMMRQYRMVFHSKFSTPFGSIFFAILALPLALIFGKHNGQTICLIFGLVISLLYWTLMILGQLFSVRIGFNPVILMWFPDLLVGVIGLLLYLALRRK